MWRLLLLVVVAFYGGPAFAIGTVSQQGQTYWTATHNGPCTGTWGGAQAAAIGCAAQKNQTTCTSATQTGGSGGSLTFSVTCNTVFPVGQTFQAAVGVQSHNANVCPPGSMLQSDGRCLCLPGSRPNNNNECVAYQCPANALKFANDGHGPFTNAADAIKSRLSCVGPGGPYYGCTLEYTARSAKCADGTHCWSEGSSALNGEYCDGNPPPLPPEEPVPPQPPMCTGQAGMCPGEVNGVQGCYPCSTTTDKPTTETETDPEGNTTETETKTECNGTTCTTTTTTTNGGGTTVNVEVEPQPGFCEQNPTFSACQEGMFGGACGGAFTCEGDAVQCAIAKDQHLRHCQLLEDHTAFSQAGAAMVDDDPHPDGHPRNDPETKTIDFGTSIDQSNPLSGSCPQDRQFRVGSFGSVTVPLASLCSPLQVVGNVAVAFALLAAAFIAFKQG